MPAKVTHRLKGISLRHSHERCLFHNSSSTSKSNINQDDQHFHMAGNIRTGIDTREGQVIEANSSTISKISSVTTSPMKAQRSDTSCFYK